MLCVKGLRKSLENRTGCTKEGENFKSSHPNQKGSEKSKETFLLFEHIPFLVNDFELCRARE